LYRRLGGPQGQSGKMWKISPPLGSDPWTVQPIGSRYTDYATLPTSAYCMSTKLELSHQRKAHTLKVCENKVMRRVFKYTRKKKLEKIA
jgi:hypothetical protein